MSFLKILEISGTCMDMSSVGEVQYAKKYMATHSFGGVWITTLVDCSNKYISNVLISVHAFNGQNLLIAYLLDII